MRWNDSTPIYLQIKESICCSIIEMHINEGETIPSIREFSSENRVNPLTVSKAYQLLVEEGILLKRRGLGMIVNDNARQMLLKQQRTVFIKTEWPAIQKKIARLGLTIEELIS